MYAGNVGFSQSLELLIEAAGAMPEVMFVVNGDGAARADLEARAAGLAQRPLRRLPAGRAAAEVLASADIHVVPLRAGLGNVSVPSKTYSILAAGRPVLAAIDAGTEVPADDRGVRCRAGDPARRPGGVRRRRSRRCSPTASGLARMGAAGRRWVESAASPRAVAERVRRADPQLRRPDRREADPRNPGRPDRLSPSWPRPQLRPHPRRRSPGWPSAARARRSASRAALLFPGAIILTILIGLVTVVYARESRPDPGSAPPQVGDHWHAAYGFYVCDTWLPKFTDDKEEQTIDPQTGAQQFVDDEYAPHRRPHPRRRRRPLPPVLDEGGRQAGQAEGLPRRLRRRAVEREPR